MVFDRRSVGGVLLTLVAVLVFAATGRAQDTPPPPAEGFPLGPPSHVLRFTAEPAAIRSGQSVTLSWVVVNSDNMTIDHCVGRVPSRGTRQVSPSATTTYTLVAKGRGGNDKQSVIVTVNGTNSGANPGDVCKDDGEKPIPRIGDKPDLSGVYLGGFGIVPKEPIPVKPGAEHFKLTPDESALGPTALCVPPGVPVATMWPYPLQIVQKPDLVVILYEAYPMFRVIPTDGRPHPDNLDPTWMGDSVGHWDGDTLVVDVTGFNDKTVVGGYHHTTAYHVVEQYRRTSFDTINYIATVEDPNVFSSPWKYGGPLRLHPEWDLQEYVCEQNNKDYHELLPTKH